jgi:transcriptional antiterminator RfaH
MRGGPATTPESWPDTDWYLVQTHPHAEAKAALNLRRQGFQCYLPRYARKRRHAGRTDFVAAPLFPRYLFVGIDLSAQRWRSILSTVGVSRLVCFGDTPAKVPGPVVDGLIAMHDPRGCVQLPTRPQLRPGDEVCIANGPFASHLGLVEGMSDERRVAILLDLLGRKVRVLIDIGAIAAA